MDDSRSLKAFLALAGESIGERESKRFDVGKMIKNVSCVVMSVRVSVMCYGMFNLDPASATPCKYFFNSIALPNVL